MNNSQRLLACEMGYNSIVIYLYSMISDLNFVMNLYNKKLDWARQSKYLILLSKYLQVILKMVFVALWGSLMSLS